MDPTISTLLAAVATEDQDAVDASLESAVATGDHALVAAALAAGADASVVLHNYHFDHEVNLICLAAREGHAEVLAPLLADGANLNHWAKGLFGEYNALHIAAIYGHPEVLKELVTLGMDVNTADKEGWTAMHRAAENGHNHCIEELVGLNARLDARDKKQRTPLMIAAHGDQVECVKALMFAGADNSATDGSGCTLLDMARSKGSQKVVELLQNFPINYQRFLEAVGPLKRAVSAGDQHAVVAALEAGADASVVRPEYRGYRCVNFICMAAIEGQEHVIAPLLEAGARLDHRTTDQYNALHIAARHNHPQVLRELVTLGIDIKVRVQGDSVLHTAVKHGNMKTIDMLLTSSEQHEEKYHMNINQCDNNGYTPAYYAIKANRYDIVQRFLEYSIKCKFPVKATNDETLLQFYTERNNFGQYDNAVVRVLECEKRLHETKVSAEMCLHMQLGTTEASSKALMQLQSMYDSSQGYINCLIFYFFMTCFLLPFCLVYFDLFLDSLLAGEYYQDYVEEFNQTEKLTDNCTEHTEEYVEKLYITENSSYNFTEEMAYSISNEEKYCLFVITGKTKFIFTMFFIVFPIVLDSLWNLYIHITQEDILPFFQNLPNFLRVSVYTMIFCTPLAPAMTYFENFYAQISYMSICASQKQRSDSKEENEKIRKSYKMKTLAQMRVAITNVIQATLESAFQLILQLFLIASNYDKLDMVAQATWGSILTLKRGGLETQLLKQCFSVTISLVSLTWSFTSYHRYSKFGGLSILNSLPLLFAIFFQVFSRAIACTVFTIAYTWRIFIVLSVHLLIVWMMKLKLERPVRPQRNHYLRPDFYVFLGTVASSLIYFRLERPTEFKKQLGLKHSTVFIQVLFLILTFVENTLLLSFGIIGLDSRYDRLFIICATTLCILSFIFGVILHGVYYGVWGHPWVNINGPTVTHNHDKGTVHLAYYHRGKMSKWTIHSCCSSTHIQEEPTNKICGTQNQQIDEHESCL